MEGIKKLKPQVPVLVPNSVVRKRSQKGGYLAPSFSFDAFPHILRVRGLEGAGMAGNTAEERLKELGLVLPKAAGAVANYVPWAIVGACSTLQASCRGSMA